MSNTPAILAENVSISATSGGGGMMQPKSMGEVVQFSQLMAQAAGAIPRHLRDQPGMCMAVTIQAMRWEMDPFAVASKSYFVNDRMAYESQLISAVINTRANLKKKPAITFSGEGPTRVCKVVGEFNDGSVHDFESPEIQNIKPQNSPLWETDPDQQLSYYSIRGFGRRHCPEVLLGVYDKEEIIGIKDEAPKDITPMRNPLIDHGDKVDNKQRLQTVDAADMIADTEQPTKEKPVPDDHTDTVDAETGEVTQSPHSEPLGEATPLLKRLEDDLIACKTEQNVTDVTMYYQDEINSSDPETKKAAKRLRGERLLEITSENED